MDRISVETTLAWRWRCLAEGKTVPGAELRIARSPATTLLVESNLEEVDRDKLRCPCGGQVIPVAPMDKEIGGE